MGKKIAQYQPNTDHGTSWPRLVVVVGKRTDGQMTYQVSNFAFREALWVAHGKKCFYGGGSLLFRDMQVDHVIPQTVNGRATERASLLASLGLPATFDILGRENVVPACSICNRKKGDTILPVGILSIHLENVRKAFPKIDSAMDFERKARKADNLLREVAKALTSGEITQGDIDRLTNVTEYMTEQSIDTVVKRWTARELTPEHPKSSRNTEIRISFVRDVANAIGERNMTVAEFLDFISDANKLISAYAVSREGEGRQYVAEYRDAKVEYGFAGSGLEIRRVDFG